MSPDTKNTKELYKNRSGLEKLTDDPSDMCVMGLSTLLFLGALCMPAVFVGADRKAVWGIWLLIIGMPGLLSGYYQWLANIIIWFGFERMGHRQYGWASVLFGITLALCLAARQIKSMPLNTGGVNQPIVDFGWGYYFWVASATLPFLACLIRMTNTFVGSEAAPAEEAKPVSDGSIDN